MRKLFVVITILILCSITDLLASSPFYFLRYNQSARAAAISGCFVSMIDDPSAVFFNPATISTVESKKFSATFLKHVLDINSGNISYIYKDKELGNFAGSVIYTNYGSFDATDIKGIKNGTFSANDVALGLTYSNYLDTNLYYGATVKFIYAIIDDASSFAMALDAGIIYTIPETRTNLGLSVLHAGSQLSYFENENESLPLDVRMGINHRLIGLPLLVNFSFHHLADEQDSFFDKFLNFSVGGELYLGQFIQVRLGYDNQIRREATPDTDKKLSGISGGLGIKTKNINFDYGIAQIGSAATLHRFSITLDI